MSEETQFKHCPFCAESILSVAKKCRFCGEYLEDERPRGHRATSTGLERMLVPVDRPASAIMAGYCGLLGLFPMIGLPFAIGAIVTGCVALKTLKQRPEFSGAGRAWFGLICGILMTVLSTGLLILMFVAKGVRH